MKSQVSLAEIKLMFVKSSDGPKGATAAFTKLESFLPTLKGRRFYGLISDEGETYLACVALTAGDRPEVWGLEVGSIPSGNYVKTKIEDWPKNLGQIIPASQSMSHEYGEDSSRPRVEFYRSQTELILLLPTF